MSYKAISVTIIVTLYTVSRVNSNCDPSKYGNNAPQFTRVIRLRQGRLRGVVYEPRENRDLQPVEVYRGIPYAAPPVGELRFMPTVGGPSWFNVKCADTFGPVCPQTFPDSANMSYFRREYFLRLRKYLEHQSEDCLYLNIYAPFQGPNSSRKYPVMVYIHGESFEWNSGNPYDASVLASHGNVIVVTLNFRLGILGFLKAGTEELSRSNFGIVDQIAALLWVKENIEEFGGDPKSVTLFGHGTGAVCANLLMISPMILQDNNQRLFHRAILMGGSALADWALAGNPSEVTYQVSQALNCQIQDDFAACLRRKQLREIMAAGATTPAYKTRFGPIVDSLVVPNDPRKSMTQYHDIFKGFELMYGVTEQESVHLLRPEDLAHGMLEKERDQELRKYVRSRCEMKPEVCFVRTLAEYKGGEFSPDDYTGHEPDKASLARDALLDILSDARTVAPVVQMARYHADLNMQSYFYVFTHKTSSKEYIRNKSFNGEELPYVFGIPLDGPKFHFTDSYTDMEKLFSQIVMNYFCNFAYTGNPNVPRRNQFLSDSPAIAFQLDVEWPEYDAKEERYLELEIPPQPSSRYRNKEITYWNEIFPRLSENQSFIYSRPPSIIKKPPKVYVQVPNNPPYRKQYPPPWIYNNIPENVSPTRAYSRPQNTIGTVIRKTEKERPETVKYAVYGTELESPPKEVRPTPDPTMNIVIIAGSLFLIANVILLIILYFKCYRNKKNDLRKVDEVVEISEEEKISKEEKAFLVNGCNIVRMISKSSKSDETYEAVKCSGSSKYKLTRQMSNSTIDAHAKVRDWIANEVVNKYSPRFIRRPKLSPHTKSKIPVKDDVSIPVEPEKDSTLGRSPTRPVSPSDDLHFQQPVMKTSTITRPKLGKPSKVSVAIDATPTGRGPSVLMQRPAELTKSLDCPLVEPETDIPLRRSVTLEDFSPRVVDGRKELRKSSTSINLKFSDGKSHVMKIKHNHSHSDPVQDLYVTKTRKLKTFDPNSDVNVTSRDDNEQKPTPLTPEESLMTIKRRKFPKVLPDHPGRETLMQKRRSMPAHCLFLPIPESSSFSQPNSPTNKDFAKLPPAPPPRTTTLPKQSHSAPVVCLSEPMLAKEPYYPEPEVVCNNLYVGPLVPKEKNGSKGELNTLPIYDSLRNIRATETKVAAPKTIVTANSNAPIKRADPKFVVRPTISRKSSEDKHTKNIPRVVVPDNQPQVHQHLKPNNYVKSNSENGENTINENNLDAAEASDEINLRGAKTKRSQIPTPVRIETNLDGSPAKTSSSSESTPSEESDTGTVVKKI